MLQQCLQLLCDALHHDALPAAEVALVEQWVARGLTPATLSRLIEQRQGRTISSVRYFTAGVEECLTAVSRETIKPARPRLLSERPWADYLAHQCHGLVRPDADLIADYRCRWERERRVLGLPIGEDD